MKFNSEVAIGLNTFLRDDSLKRFIASCKLYYPELKIYVVDQSHGFDEKKKKFYAYLRSEGHCIQKIPYDCGISEARERLRKFVKEPYIMYMQDDFIVCPDTNIYAMLEILKQNKKIGVVCGSVTTRKNKPWTAEIPEKAHAYFLQKIDNKIVYMPVQYLIDIGLIKTKHLQSIKYVICDMGLDFSLWRKDAQEGIFDSEVHVLEHSHVYLNLQKIGKYKVAYTWNSCIVHTHSRENDTYVKFRMRKDDMPYLNDYWGVKEFIVLGGEDLFPKMTALKDVKPLDVQTVSDINALLIDFVRTMQTLNKKVVLAKETCLQAVCNHKLTLADLYVSISRLSPDDIQYLASKKFFYSVDSQTFVKDNTKIFVDYKLPQQTKLVPIENKYYEVPMPVFRYLDRTFGTEWRKLGEKYGKQ